MQSPSINIRPANNNDIKFLKEKIAEFCLDDAGFEIQQFLIAECENEKLGFGRVREHQSCSEMCTLGVIEHERSRGVGKLLSSYMIKKAAKETYLVCIIPEFFIPFNFEIVNEYPKELSEKLHRCETQLSVPEKYVVMKLKK